MKNIVHTLLSLTLFGACALVAQAQPALKILTVDMNKLYSGHWETEEQNIKLKHDQDLATQDLERMNTEGTALYAQFKALDEQSKSPALTPEARAKIQADAQKKYDEIQSKQNDVNTFRANTQKVLDQRITGFRDMMLEQITSVAAKIARDKGATLLLDKYGQTAISVSNIIYVDPAYDITDEVMKELNKDRPPAPATPPAAPAVPAPAAGTTAPTPAGAKPSITVPEAKK